jgi:protein-S-isoprenylcysteine O-methyltransferase Ste14
VSATDGQGDLPSAAVERTAWSLMLGQFVLLGLVVLLPRRVDWTLPLGLARVGQVVAWASLLLIVAAAVQLGRGLTAAPLPNDHAQLRTDGLYGQVRHPIYAGLLLFAIARTLTSGSAWAALACALLVVLINMKARWEERHLAERFPDYPAYARDTPRFIPWPNRK